MERTDFGISKVAHKETLDNGLEHERMINNWYLENCIFQYNLYQKKPPYYQ